MPHLRIRAVQKEKMQQLSRSLIPELAKLLNSPEDNFTLELIASDFFHQGQETASYPFVEILWFARPQILQDQTARLITDQLRSLTQAVDIVVVFQTLEKSAYYENGNHF